ncbi:hypothetical protein [Brevibacillus brevis]|uniref:hypothetical protein n=1 Tax=Brevibacillus brevis TaxID=1393 RepID=UPI0037C79A24
MNFNYISVNIAHCQTLHFPFAKYKFENNRNLLYQMGLFSSGGPIIAELWSPAAKIANNFIFEAWDSLLRSGIIASLEFDEMEAYRQAIKAIRDAVFCVRKAQSNWVRVLTWDKPMYSPRTEIAELKQVVPPDVILQQDVKECEKAIKDALEESDRAIRLLESNNGI